MKWIDYISANIWTLMRRNLNCCSCHMHLQIMEFLPTWASHVDGQGCWKHVYGHRSSLRSAPSVLLNPVNLGNYGSNLHNGLYCVLMNFGTNGLWTHHFLGGPPDKVPDLENLGSTDSAGAIFQAVRLHRPFLGWVLAPHHVGTPGFDRLAWNWQWNDRNQWKWLLKRLNML